MPARLTKALRALTQLARNPWLLNQVLAADTATWQRQALAHVGGLGPGAAVAAAGLPVVPLAHFLPPSGPHSVGPFAFREGGSLLTDLLLLRALARARPGCRYFEIGTWRGESAANVAQEAATVHTLNLSAAEMRRLGLAEDYIKLHGFFSQPYPTLTSRTCTATRPPST